eukprot:6970222-Lingulodinium_polyedra.AAC.1
MVPFRGGRFRLTWLPPVMSRRRQLSPQVMTRFQMGKACFLGESRGTDAGWRASRRGGGQG